MNSCPVDEYTFHNACVSKPLNLSQSAILAVLVAVPLPNSTVFSVSLAIKEIHQLENVSQNASLAHTLIKLQIRVSAAMHHASSAAALLNVLSVLPLFF